MNKILRSSIFLLQFFLLAFSNQASAQDCPTSAFHAGILWANGCTIQNVDAAAYFDEPIQYIWIKSTASGGNCESSIPQLLPLNVGDIYDAFVAAGGFSGGASPAIGTTSWSFATDNNDDDLSFELTGVDVATCYSRCARVVGCSSFYGEAATTVEPCTTLLPVELTRFDGEADGCNIHLSWSSSSEENFSHYEVERSNDGRTFELAESIKGSNSIEGSHYFLNDKNAGIENYYRLKMIDFDLTYEYSKIINVDSDCEIIKRIVAFPNPVGDDFINVKVESNRESEQVIRLVDITGLEILKKNVSLREGINTFELDISELPGRIYFIKVGKQVHFRFTKTSER